jgi:hypothetical protein
MNRKVKVHNPCKVSKTNRLAESSEWTIESLDMECTEESQHHFWIIKICLGTIRRRLRAIHSEGWWFLYFKSMLSFAQKLHTGQYGTLARRWGSLPDSSRPSDFNLTRQIDPFNRIGTGRSSASNHLLIRRSSVQIRPNRYHPIRSSHVSASGLNRISN